MLSLICDVRVSLTHHSLDLIHDKDVKVWMQMLDFFKNGLQFSYAQGVPSSAVTIHSRLIKNNQVLSIHNNYI